MIGARFIIVAIYAIVFFAVFFLLEKIARKQNWNIARLENFFFLFAFSCAVIQKDAPYFSFTNAEILFGFSGVLAFLIGFLLLNESSKKNIFITYNVVVSLLLIVSFSNFQPALELLWAAPLAIGCMLFFNSSVFHNYSTYLTIALSILAILLGPEVFLGIVTLAATMAFLVYKRSLNIPFLGSAALFLQAYIQTFFVLTLVKRVLEFL